MAGWGGVIAGAALGGIASAGQALYDDQVEKDKAEAQAARDAALADLQKRNQIDVHAANLKADVAAIPAREAAKSKAALENIDADTQVSERRALSDARAKAKAAQDPMVQAGKEAEASTTARAQAAASKYIEENRTPEQQKKAKLELDKIQADINKDNAAAGASREHGAYYKAMGEAAKKNSETKSETAADKEGKWTYPDKTDPTKAIGPGGIIRIEVEPTQMPEPAKPGIMGTAWGAKPAKPFKGPTYKYMSPDGVELSFAEVAKVLGGKAEDFAKAASEAGGPIAVPKASATPPAVGVVPPGYIPIGRDKATGKTVYRGPDGGQYIQ